MRFQWNLDNSDGYSKFVVSSSRASEGSDATSGIKDIEKVIKIFSFSNLHPLIGYKLTQYYDKKN